MKYIERKKSVDQRQEKELKYLEAANKMQLQMDLLETQKAKEEAKLQLDIEKSKDQLDVDALIALQNAIDGYEKGEKFINELIEELF